MKNFTLSALLLLSCNLHGMEVLAEQPQDCNHQFEVRQDCLGPNQHCRSKHCLVIKYDIEKLRWNGCMRRSSHASPLQYWSGDHDSLYFLIKDAGESKIYFVEKESDKQHILKITTTKQK